MTKGRTMSEQDEAIIELANVARGLLERLDELNDSPISIRRAIRNKIEYYASRAHE